VDTPKLEEIKKETPKKTEEKKVDTPKLEELKKEESKTERPSFTKTFKVKKSINTNSVDEASLKQVIQLITTSNVLEYKERKYKDKSLPKCYIAFEIIEWLLWTYNITRKRGTQNWSDVIR